MEQTVVIDIARDAIATVLWVSLPILMMALVIGLLVSIFQTVTSIQEQTLAFVPKIIAVFIGLLLFGPFMMTRVIEFTTRLYQSFNMYIR